jgi:hypothetical protein
MPLKKNVPPKKKYAAIENIPMQLFAKKTLQRIAKIYPNIMD